MIGEKIQGAMNAQIREELYSAYLYLSMAAYFHATGLDGMGQWMQAQSVEEVNHALRFFSHINELVTLAIQEGDHAANAMLQWFVTEQVEEEATAAKVVDQLERIGDSGNGLLMMDRELGQRQTPTNLTGQVEGE